jgi:hypothetical protein
MKKIKKRYTVVGIYTDNEQSYVTMTDAASPLLAAEATVRQAESRIEVVAVFAGDHKDLMPWSKGDKRIDQERYRFSGS